MAVYCHVIVGGSQFIDDAGLVYEVPPFLVDSICEGILVYVPYGKNNRLITGFVMDVFAESKRLAYEIKQVHMLQTVQPVLSESQLLLAKFISRYYVCSMESVIKQMIPRYYFDHCFVAIRNIYDGTILPYNETLYPSIESGEFSFEAYISDESPFKNKVINIQPSPSPMIVNALKRAPRQQEIYDFVSNHPNCSFELLKSSYPNAKSFISKLCNKGLLTVSESPHEYAADLHDGLLLNPSQQQILEALSDELLSNSFSKHLINGVTGSGKTLIYERLAQLALSRGRQVLIMEPEIMLSSQIFERLRQRFGPSLALMHSKMTDRERFDVWKSVSENRIHIIVGPRSAVFMPFRDLGLVVVDEEHDDSYKQIEPDPRYHAMACAEFIARENKALLLLGSATPSMGTLYEVVHHRCKIHNLPERANHSALPQVALVDMKEERKKGNFSIFSRDLNQAIQDALAKNEQVILFMNKKGYASSVTCLDCGEVIKCPRCDIPLTYYQSSGSFKCGYCGYTISKLSVCPNCYSSNLDYSGIGTESIEEASRTLFPSAACARLDAQAIESEARRNKILADFNNNRVQILVGTQIIAKGLDFKNVSCVGVINADVTLNMPDYSSAERTFQLMVQVSGRAGRHGKASHVFIQSFQPEHYALQFAVHNDLHHFFLKEIENRRKWLYPPLVSLCRILISDPSQQKTERLVRQVADYLLTNNDFEEIVMLGPAPAPLQRKNNRYRYHILLKSASRELLQSMMQQLRQNMRQFNLRSSRVIIDMDPKSML